MYCVVGVLVNKGAGKTGKEMIPNSKFWSDLPGLIAVSELFYSLISRRLSRIQCGVEILWESIDNFFSVLGN